MRMQITGDLDPSVLRQRSPCLPRSPHVQEPTKSHLDDSEAGLKATRQSVATVWALWLAAVYPLAFFFRGVRVILLVPP